MPGRATPLVTGQYYHIFNRGNNRQPTFIKKREYLRAVDSLKFYLHVSPPVKFSRLLTLPQEKKQNVLEKLFQKQKLAKLLAFCFMPNHYHLLTKQLVDNGIAKLMSNFQNSYTRYFNTKNERTGSLFENQFKAIRIETDEQLIHVSRYIHLNPYVSSVVKTPQELIHYPWSSLPEYLNSNPHLCNLETIANHFPNVDTHRKFILNQTSYQRELHKIKHLIIDT